jgi:hypothetical protein
LNFILILEVNHTIYNKMNATNKIIKQFTNEMDDLNHPNKDKEYWISNEIKTKKISLLMKCILLHNFDNSFFDKLSNDFINSEINLQCENGWTALMIIVNESSYNNELLNLLLKQPNINVNLQIIMVIQHYICYVMKIIIQIMII